MKRVGVLAVVVAFGLLSAEGHASRPDSDFRATMRISPGPHLFGDTVTAELDVFVDPARVDTHSVRVDTSFGQWTRTRFTRGTRDVDGLVEFWYRYSLVCLAQECVPKGRVKAIKFPQATLRYRGRHGERRPTFLMSWPGFQLIARAPQSGTSTDTFFGLFNGGNTAAMLTFHTPSLPPPTKFRMDPVVLGVLLLLLGALVTAGAGMVAFPVALRVRDTLRAHAPAAPPRTRVEEALDDVRMCAERDPGSPAHREALARLARELGPAGAADLVRPATRLAWSEDAPTTVETLDLADQVAARLNGAAT